jgi:hypothetical protein
MSGTKDFYMMEQEAADRRAEYMAKQRDIQCSVCGGWPMDQELPFFFEYGAHPDCWTAEQKSARE